MNNFEEEARMLIESGGGIQINDPADMYDALNHLLADREERQRRGEKAQATVFKNRGAVDKTIELIEGLEIG
jgi:3-deoxy-D-manno-octulosonic-acid transferase